MTEIALQSLWEKVIAQFPLGKHSDHGPNHWKRVERNGLHIAAESGARTDVVRLFAVFHDSRRENEYTDPAHGKRGAELALEWRGTMFEIDDEGFALLHEACSVHTDLFNSDNITIGTCLDADRLDLPRVGITPDPKYMSTPIGRQLARDKSLQVLS